MHSGLYKLELHFSQCWLYTDFIINYTLLQSNNSAAKFHLLNKNIYFYKISAYINGQSLISLIDIIFIIYVVM